MPTLAIAAHIGLRPRPSRDRPRAGHGSPRGGRHGRLTCILGKHGCHFGARHRALAGGASRLHSRREPVIGCRLHAPLVLAEHRCRLRVPAAHESQHHRRRDNEVAPNGQGGQARVRVSVDRRISPAGSRGIGEDLELRRGAALRGAGCRHVIGPSGARGGARCGAARQQRRALPAGLLPRLGRAGRRAAPRRQWPSWPFASPARQEAPSCGRARARSRIGMAGPPEASPCVSEDGARRAKQRSRAAWPWKPPQRAAHVGSGDVGL